MIIEGAARSNGTQLGQYLLGLIGHENDNITVLDVDHPAGDLLTATSDMQAATGSGQRGTKGLYHAQINPAIGENENMSLADWHRCADVLEAQLGFEGQSRVLVLHEKNGRTHLHVAWQRYDFEKGNLKSDSWNYKKHELAARQLEKELGHEPIKRAHLDGEKRSDQAYDMALAEQAARSKRDPAQLKEAIGQAWDKSDTAAAFNAALTDQGLILAKGDKRAHVVIDEQGEIYSLSRQLRGTAKAKEIKARLAGIDERLYPTVQEAQQIQRNISQSARLSKEADKMAKQQAGARLRLGTMQRQDAKAFVKDQMRELAEYDSAASDLLASQRAQDKAPGAVYTLFLKTLNIYDKRMAAREKRDSGRVVEVKEARADFRTAQLEIRDDFKKLKRRDGKKLLVAQSQERQALPEREQALMPARITQYMDKYREVEKPKDDDKREDEDGEKRPVDLILSASQKRAGDLQEKPGDPPMQIIKPMSERSAEERREWEEEKRRRAEEARQRLGDKDKGDHDK